MKSFLDINWKLRLKSPLFWVTKVIAVGSIVTSYLNIDVSSFGTYPSLIQEVGHQLSIPSVSLPIIVAVGAYIVDSVTDYTTKGLKDSTQALTYKKPKE